MGVIDPPHNGVVIFFIFDFSSLLTKWRKTHRENTLDKCDEEMKKVWKGKGAVGKHKKKRSKMCRRHLNYMLCVLKEPKNDGGGEEVTCCLQLAPIKTILIVVRINK